MTAAGSFHLGAPRLLPGPPQTRRSTTPITASQRHPMPTAHHRQPWWSLCVVHDDQATSRASSQSSRVLSFACCASCRVASSAETPARVSLGSVSRLGLNLNPVVRKRLTHSRGSQNSRAVQNRPTPHDPRGAFRKQGVLLSRRMGPARKTRPATQAFVPKRDQTFHVLWMRFGLT